MIEPLLKFDEIRVERHGEKSFLSHTIRHFNPFSQGHLQRCHEAQSGNCAPTAADYENRHSCEMWMLQSRVRCDRNIKGLIFRRHNVSHNSEDNLGTWELARIWLTGGQHRKQARGQTCFLAQAHISFYTHSLAAKGQQVFEMREGT